MTVTLESHGFSVDVCAPWELMHPANYETILETHGLFVKSGEVEGHLRSIPSHACTLTLQGLRDFLNSQSWASPPFETVEWDGPVIGIAGTFRMLSRFGSGFALI